MHGPTDFGINGVPAFVFNGGLVTCGAQEPAVLARIIDVARELEPLPASADDEEAALAASLIGDVGLS